MVIKVFVSSTSGNMVIKGNQDFIHRLFLVKKIEFEEVDISDPQLEEQKAWMRKNAQPKEGKQNVLPPQIFNEEEYCGDYDQLHAANEGDTLRDFLKLGGTTPEAEEPEQNGEKADEIENEVEQEKDE